MSLRVLFVVVTLALVGGVSAYQLDLVSQVIPGSVANTAGPATHETYAATRDEPRSVVALGRLEPSDDVVEVSNILVGDIIVSLVEEGTRVARNDELGRLDETFRKTDVDLAAAQYDEAKQHLDAERATAETQLASAQLALRQAKEGAAVELEAQEKRVELIRLDFVQTGADLARLEALSTSSDSIVSAQELEHQRLLRDKAESEMQSAEASLRQLKQSTRFNQQTAEANVRAAEVALEAVDKRSTLESLQVRLRIAEERLERSRIMAPISGTVLEVYTRVGESIAERPVLQMADLTRFDCIAEVFETDIKYISIGDEVLVRSRAFLGPFESTYVTGHVKRIGNAMPTRELSPLDPLAPVDKHVVQVEIDLSDKTHELVELLGETDNVMNKAQALVNLRVEVTFPAQDRRSASPPAA